MSESAPSPLSVRLEEISGLKELARRSIFGAMVYFLVVVAAAASTDFLSTDPRWILSMGVITLIIGVLRILLSLRLSRDETEISRTLHFLFNIVIFFNCASWGCFAGFVTVYYLGVWKGSLVLLSSAALLAGLTQSLAPVPAVARMGLCSMGLPVIACAIYRDDASGYAFALLLSVFLAFQLVQAKHSFSAFQAILKVAQAEAVRREAEIAAEAKADLLARMSHDIRTPLNGVIGMLELLRQTPAQGDHAELLGHCYTSASNLRRILNSILEYSRNERAGIEAHRESFALQPWLRETLAPFEFEARQKEIHFVSMVHSGVSKRYFGDAIQIARILTNLVSNAVKFTTKGIVSVSVSAPNDKGERIQFIISDTGPGISSATLDRLFDPYISGDSQSANHPRGAGLGLAITRQLVEGLGGSIKVQSSTPLGTTFCFSIPVETDPITRFPEDQSSEVLPNFRGSRILVVDDDATNRLVVTRLVQKMGATVEEATNGFEAVEHARGKVFDLILMDIVMPQMDGITAARTIRGSDISNRKTPIVALTATLTQDCISEARQAGVDSVISKPASLQELAVTMVRFCRRSSAAKA